MDYKKKQEAICKLWHNKVFDTVSTKYTDRNFPKEVLGCSRGSFQNVIYGKAKEDGVNIIWNKLKKYYVIDDDYLFALARIEDDYNRIQSVIGADKDVYEWAFKFWLDGCSPEGEVTLALPENLEYSGILLAYCFYRQAPEEYRGYTLGKMKDLFLDKFIQSYKSLDVYNLKKPDPMIDRYEFLIIIFCTYISDFLKQLKTYKIENVIQPWKDTTYWIDTLEYPEGTIPKSFYIFDIFDKETYAIIKSSIDPQKPELIFFGVAVIKQNANNTTISMFDGEGKIHFSINLSENELIIYYTTGEIAWKLRQVDISQQVNGKYTHTWINMVNKTIESEVFNKELENICCKFANDTRLVLSASCQVIDKIKNSNSLFYKLQHNSKIFWIQIDFGKYQELKTLQDDELEIAESNGSFYFVWPPCNRISLDKFEHLSNEDVIHALGLI